MQVTSEKCVGVSDLRGCIWSSSTCLRNVSENLQWPKPRKLTLCMSSYLPTILTKRTAGVSQISIKNKNKIMGISNVFVNGINSVGSILWNLGGFWRSWKKKINFHVFEVLCIWKKMRKGGNLACKIGRFWIDMQRGQKVQNGRVSIGREVLRGQLYCGEKPWGMHWEFWGLIDKKDRKSGNKQTAPETCNSQRWCYLCFSMS